MTNNFPVAPTLTPEQEAIQHEIDNLTITYASTLEQLHQAHALRLRDLEEWYALKMQDLVERKEALAPSTE